MRLYLFVRWYGLVLRVTNRQIDVLIINFIIIIILLSRFPKQSWVFYFTFKIAIENIINTAPSKYPRTEAKRISVTKYTSFS